jgi:hypothetical protein
MRGWRRGDDGRQAGEQQQRQHNRGEPKQP